MVSSAAGSADWPPAQWWWGGHPAEWRWQLELGRLLVDPLWWGVGVPRGDGAPVLLIPGFLAGDLSTAWLRHWLSVVGYRPHQAGISWNVGCSDHALDRLEAQLERIAAAADRPVTLVGHSRGGHFAKALATRRPGLVARVVTLGSGLDDPFDISVPTAAAVALVRGVLQRDPVARERGCFTTGCRCRFTADYTAPFPAAVPLTSIYTRGDGVVRWQSCVVPYARCVPVRGSHLGLVVNREVYRELGEVLTGRRDGPVPPAG